MNMTMLSILALYFLIGIVLLILKPFRRSVSEAVEKFREAPFKNAARDRPEAREKKVILFYPTSKYILKKNERWLKIEVDYNPKILSMSQIDLHEERTGMLYDGNIPVNFIVVRNGEILKYDLEKLDEISLQMEPIFSTDRVTGIRKI